MDLYSLIKLPKNYSQKSHLIETHELQNWLMLFLVLPCVFGVGFHEAEQTKGFESIRRHQHNIRLRAPFTLCTPTTLLFHAPRRR